MARRDYICCSRCGCKVIYDGEDTIRDQIDALWPGKRLYILCPDCLERFSDAIDRVWKE